MFERDSACSNRCLASSSSWVRQAMLVSSEALDWTSARLARAMSRGEGSARSAGMWRQKTTAVDSAATAVTALSTPCRP